MKNSILRICSIAFLYCSAQLNAQLVADNGYSARTDHGNVYIHLNGGYDSDYLDEGDGADELADRLNTSLLNGVYWDAGNSGCTHSTCTGGESNYTILDTQPKYANSAMPITNRVADCPPGYTNNGLTCGRGTDDIPNGGSRAADCPSGYTNNGLTCGRGTDDTPNGGSRAADCPSGYTNNGLTCGRGTDDISSGGSRAADCPSGYTNTGLTCYRGPSTYTKGCTTVFKKYPCKSGYTDNGCFCGRGASSKGESSMTCRSGEFKSAGRCYKNCPAGYTNMGLTCHRPASTKGIGSMTCRSGEFFSGGRCYKKCPTGYTNMGATCHRPASTKGIGSMTCKPNEFISGGRCYKECPAGYTNMGATCHRPASTKGIETMTCKPGELISIGRCYKCSADREYYGGLCYKKCPEGSDRTAISTCAHHVKLRGNTHLWMVDHGLDLLKTSSDPIAQRAVARMNNPKCRTQWEKGLWDMDASPYADTPEGSSRGSHFYNGAKKDAWGDPTSITTYALLGVDVTENIDGTFNPDAQQTAASNISAISNLMGSEDDCNKLGRALHYMTDMTQPMHTSGFSGISIPTMLHPVFEFYVPYVQNKFPVNVSWTERWTDLSPNDAFHKASVQSNSLSPKLMKSLKYDGTICTINVEGIVYTGYCFINDKKVDEQIGIVLRDGYQSVASYIYTVFKDKAPAGRANLRQAPLSNSNADYSGEFRVKVKADNLFWHCDGGSERKLVSTKWQPTDDYTRFIFERQSSGYYRIRVKADNRYLHVDGGNPQQPLSTQWQPESTDACTHFLLEKNTDGSFRIKVKCTGKYLFEEGNTPNKLLSTKNQVDATSTNTHFYLVGE